MSTARLMGAVFATLLSRMFRMTVWLYVVPADLPTNLLFYLLLNKLLSFPRDDVRVTESSNSNNSGSNYKDSLFRSRLADATTNSTHQGLRVAANYSN